VIVVACYCFLILILVLVLVLGNLCLENRKKMLFGFGFDAFWCLRLRLVDAGVGCV
jgi:hypothetical protein